MSSLLLSLLIADFAVPLASHVFLLVATYLHGTQRVWHEWELVDSLHLQTPGMDGGKGTEQNTGDTLLSTGLFVQRVTHIVLRPTIAGMSSCLPADRP